MLRMAIGWEARTACPRRAHLECSGEHVRSGLRPDTLGGHQLAIFHLSARAPIARAIGRSATAAAAYRAGTVICDSRTGLKFDYSRKRGVLDARIHLPGGRCWADRAGFWNSVEEHHRRRDAVVAREVVIALPAELDADARAQLAFDFAREIADEFGVAVDCALHAPSRDGDDRNHHAHLLFTACSVGVDGAFGKKVERLDPIACRRSSTPDSVSWLRPRWEHLVNAALTGGGSTERVDHRSHKARGIARHPTVHVGKKGASVRARVGLNSRLRKKNAQATALEEQISKLMRMRARLAARAAMDVADCSTDDRQAPSALPKNSVAIPGLQHGPHAAEDRSADLSPWRRREDRQLKSQSTVLLGPIGSDGSNPETSTDVLKGGSRRVVGRARR